VVYLAQLLLLSLRGEESVSALVGGDDVLL
jgi:hypothetical protein